MQIAEIKVKNYRLLKNFSITLEDELSLIVGKNNTGKTSLLTVMNKFLNGADTTRFSFDDFNIDLKNQIKELVESEEVDSGNFTPIGIEMRLLIRYDDNDSLSNVSRVMMDLDPEHYYILLYFGCTINYESLIKLKEDYRDFLVKERAKRPVMVQELQGANEPENNQDLVETEQQSEDQIPSKDLFYFLKNNLEYFKSSRKSLSCSKVTGEEDGISYIDLDTQKISLKDIINFKYISAKRDVTNRDIDKTLSVQTSKIYRKTEETADHSAQIEKFKDQLIKTDTVLSNVYSSLFKVVIDKVSKFGGIRVGESKINIESTLQHRQLLEGNTTVMYSHGGHTFPEYNNGLGYMNLISIIFEIEILLLEFQRTKKEVPADINFLFIEEPEAHTHPQMQYVFIKNIKNLLKEGIVREDEENRKLQYIISTHSAHIVSESDFDDIRYLKRNSETSVIAKSLKSLESQYLEDGQEKNYRFLTQYLTLNKAELFFADKAILVEGDTERILLPAMMKKIDQEQPINPILSQNISIVEVGAYSHVFEKFIEFIGLTKCLIITDIDSYYNRDLFEADGTTPQRYKNGNQKTESIKCPILDPLATYTSNSSLKFFHKNNNLLDYFKRLPFDWKILRKNRKKEWVSNRKGNVLLVYQTTENGYGPRSFEDAFISINRDFIINSENQFRSIMGKYLKQFKDNEIGVFEFAEKGIDGKPSFAIEILLNSKEAKTESEGETIISQFTNWKTPEYINEGLLWLKQD